MQTVDKKEHEKAVEESFEVLLLLENELNHKKFFGGENIGLVDITASYVAFWLPVIEEVVGFKWLTAERFPNLYKWSQHFIKHPEVQEGLPPREGLLAFAKAFYEKGV